MRAYPCPCLFRFVIGQPLEAPSLVVPGQPSQEEVEAFHARFYDALRELWAAHAKEFPGYGDIKLVVAGKDGDVVA